MSDRTLTRTGQNDDGAATVNHQPADERLHRTIARMQDSPEWFIDGDDRPWKELCSQGENVTIADGGGDYERGWAQVACPLERTPLAARWQPRLQRSGANGRHPLVGTSQQRGKHTLGEVRPIKN